MKILPESLEKSAFSPWTASCARDFKEIPKLLGAWSVLSLLRHVSLACFLGLCSISICVSILRQVSARFECERRLTWNFLSRVINSCRAALASLNSSGETNLPMPCLSSTSENTSVAVATPPEFYPEQKLVLLDGW